MTFLGYSFEPGDVVVLATLLVLEGVLSFDNAAIIAALVRRLPESQRRRALLYGLAGAYTFRIAAILGASYLVANPWLRALGGAYLLYLSLSHLATRARQAAAPPAARRILGLGVFASTIVTIEAADLVFALDQIVVAVALTPKVLLIVVASMLAILALRLSALYMVRLMAWFPALESLAYVAVGWVGAKLLIEQAFDIHIPHLASSLVTAGLLVVPVVAKLVIGLVTRSGVDAPRD